MNKELFKKVQTSLDEITSLKLWWKSSVKIQTKYDELQTLINADKLTRQMVSDSLEISKRMNVDVYEFLTDYERELSFLKNKILKVKNYSKELVTVVSSPITSENDEKKATQLFKDFLNESETLSNLEHLEFHYLIEDFISQALESIHLFEFASVEDYDKIIPNLLKVDTSLDNLDEILSQMKEQQQERQQDLHFSFSNLHKNLTVLLEEF